MNSDYKQNTQLLILIASTFELSSNYQFLMDASL